VAVDSWALGDKDECFVVLKAKRVSPDSSGRSEAKVCGVYLSKQAADQRRDEEAAGLIDSGEGGSEDGLDVFGNEVDVWVQQASAFRS
jgi:hypothetical protein